MKLFNYRKSYEKGSLKVEDIGNNPMDFFVKWFNQADKYRDIIEPNAMTLSTTGKLDYPESRIVLLKEIKKRSLVFYTNYNSNKAISIKKNNKVCASFYWPPLERQVIFRGEAHKIRKKESDDYFQSRPFESQASAIVSNQSQEILNYDQLLDKLEKFIALNKNKILERPNNWGGIEISVDQIEFWQGRKNRLHNRILCSYLNNSWNYKILSP